MYMYMYMYIYICICIYIYIYYRVFYVFVCNPTIFFFLSRRFPSDDWKKRHAALMAISQSGEGCEQQVNKIYIYIYERGKEIDR